MHVIFGFLRDIVVDHVRDSAHVEAALRNVRRDGMDALKKAEKKGDITEDEHRRMSTDIQSKTDEHIRKIDEMLVQKEKEILHV